LTNVWSATWQCSHMAKPSLLFLSQTLPYPPDGGVKVRTYHIFRILARELDTTALCFYRSKTGLGDQNIDASLMALRRFADVDAFPIPQEHSRPRLLWDHQRSVLTRRPYTVYSYESRSFRERLNGLLAERTFDLVHSDSLDLSGYFDMVMNRPLVCVHHDAQSTLLRRRANHESSPWRKAYLRLQARLMEEEERLWCPKVALNVAVSEVDRATMQALAPRAQFEVVPNGVDVDHFRPRVDAGAQKGMVFVGGTTWFPNLDALRYFGSDILPLLRENGVHEPVNWVGRASAQEISEYEGKGMHLTGYVADIRPYVHNAACYIVPLRAGSGTRIKILDAWAMGKAVVSTTIGCEGLQAVDGRNILIRDSPDEFAAAVATVLSDGELRQRLGEEARRTAVEEYSWEGIGRRMVKRYRALL
jgi:polysaccharide biosynthesis protein PslH